MSDLVGVLEYWGGSKMRMKKLEYFSVFGAYYESFRSIFLIDVYYA